MTSEVETGTRRMQIRVLGCYGGEMPGYRTTSFLLNNNILLDAGAVTAALSLAEQEKIDAVVLSHSHLDHIRDLGFLADNVFSQRSRTVSIHALPETIRHLRTHIFNNLVWPDFTQIPSAENPIISFHQLRPGETVEIEGLHFLPVRVSHITPTVGFIVQNHETAFLFSADTGPTEELWSEAARLDRLAAVFLETSFPNRLARLAEISGHLCAALARTEIQKLTPSALQVRIFHLKPQYRREIIAELDPEHTGLEPLDQDEVIEL